MPEADTTTGQGTGAGAVAPNAGSASPPATGAATTGAVASDGGSAGTGAVAPATAGRSDGQAVASSGDKSGTSDEAKALKARISELEGLLDDSVKRRTKAQTELEQIRTRAAQAEGKIRMRESVDSIAEQVPSAHREEAINALHRLHVEGAIDLTSEDREAAVKVGLEKLKARFPKYLEAPTNVPHIPGVNTNGVSTQKLGFTNTKGDRVL